MSCSRVYESVDVPLVPCEPVTREIAASASCSTNESGLAFKASARTFWARAGRANERYI